MYETSEAYKKAIADKVITDSISGTITLKDGTELEISDDNLVSGSLKIVHELCDDYKIGTFNLGYMKLAFFDDSALLRDFSGAKAEISYNIKTEEGYEAVPMGIFIADGASVRRRRNTISLTAYDYGILFDCALSEDIRSMEMTAGELIEYACEKCGVEFDGIDETLPNRDVLLTPSSSQIHSYRDMIGWCAAVLCGYAVIGREGELKIISSRYKAAEDKVTILDDKEITADERMSVYSTDTRAWIANLSAYSGVTPKVYKTYITISDNQAAKAIYTLDKNPLLENKSESECDEINTNWLYFIDNFMQRGVNAQIYGDPAIDVGDVLRYSGGDIDQRKNIVSFLTRQEWRYRNYHILVGASAQLSDGFAEEEETEDSETGTTETTQENSAASPIKVISQIEKRIQRIESSTAGGVGVYVNYNKNAERFNDYSEDAVSKYSGDYSHAEGYGATAEGIYSHAEGYKTNSNGSATHTEGEETTAISSCAHAEGCKTTASGLYSHAEGNETVAGGGRSHAEGELTTASEYAAHAEGNETVASGTQSHAEGRKAVASGPSAHAEGDSTTASGYQAHAEGYKTTASWESAHAEGDSTKATAAAAHAEGSGTKASGSYSHAGGKGTIASAEAQTAIGTYNEEDENAVFLVGIGASDTERKNALTLDKEGNLHISGDVTADGNVGKTYTSGTGINVAETETKYFYSVNLLPATATTLGGVKVGKGLTVSADGLLSSTEIYSAGDGVEISDGKQISIKPATSSSVGGIIAGKGLEIDGNGVLNATGGGGGKTYAEGVGISITEGEDADIISVNIDGETITEEDGKLKSKGVTIENAAIIQEKDAQYLLHNYTYVDYIQGNKIMYGGQQNQIIVQGHVIHRSGSKASNGVTVLAASTDGTYEMESQTPNISWYTSMSFPTPFYDKGTAKLMTGIYLEYLKSGAGTYGYDVYSLTHIFDTGEEYQASEWTNYNGYGGLGFSFAWDYIYPPGSSVNGHTFEFGYVQGHRIIRYMTGDLKYAVNTGGSVYYLPFGSLAEYHAAIALTYEPATLTQVNETITEV